MTDERDSRAPQASDASEQPPRVRWTFPADARSAALVVLALLASVWALHWASAVFIPLMFALMFTHALAPVVDRMQRWHVPRVLAAGVLILGLLGGMGSLIYSLSDDAAELIESLPTAAQKLRQTMRSMQRSPEAGAIEKVQKAATQLQQAAEDRAAPPAKGVTRVLIERPKFNVNDYLWAGTLGVFGLVGQIVIVAFLTFFMLATGNRFRRKLVKIAGPTFGEKRITVEALDEITRQIQRYLLAQLFVSALVGFATWLVFVWIGLDNAGAWGVVAGVLNLIPYIGSIIVTGGAALLAFLQFGTLEMTLLVGGASLAVQLVEGYLLLPLLAGRIARMSPVVVFAAVLGWGWLWGVWGMLLGLPILMVVKVVCDRVDDLKPIGELLAE